MATPAPALVMLKRQLEAVHPSSAPWFYGIMGDARHRLRRSAHNQGDAIDIPTVLLSLYETNLLVETVRYDANNGSEPRCSRLIWARRWCGPETAWQWRRYRGLNRHELHAHLEVHHLRRWDAKPWRIR